MKKCHLMITGSSLEELESTLKQYYLTNKTNEELERTIEFDFDITVARPIGVGAIIPL